MANVDQIGRNPRAAGHGAAPELVLDGFLPYRLTVLAEAVSESLSRVYAGRQGISNPEWRVLATLGGVTEMTAKDIGASTRMHKTKVSRAIAGLEERGMLARRASEVDRREALATLTPKGRAVYQDLVPLALGFARDLEAVLSPAERVAFDRALAKLFARAMHLAEALDGSATPPGREDEE